MKRLTLLLLYIFCVSGFGQQWISIFNPVSTPMRVIRYAGNGSFVAAGNSGKIIKINDEGNSVTEVPSPVTGDIRKIQFIAGGMGYAISGLTSANQGLIKTTDYGSSWSQVSLPEGFAVTFSAFPYSGDNPAMDKLLVLSDNGNLYYSGDGGSTYSLRSNELAGSFITNLDAVNDTLIYAAGNSGKIAVSNNKGVSWNISNTTEGDYTFLDITNIYNGFAGTSEGKLLKLHETGTGTFYNQLVKENAVIRDVAAVNELSLWIIAGNSIFRSNRYLSYMTEVHTASVDMYSVALKDETLGFAVGDGGKLFRYASSQPLQPFFQWYPEIDQGANLPEIMSISYKNPNSGLAIGADGKLYQTENSGKTWMLRNDVVHPSNGRFTSVAFSANLYSEYSGFLTGENGYLAITDDGGNTWKRSDAGVSVNLNAVKASGDVFVVVGDAGTVISSPDRGKTLYRYNNQFSSDLIALDFVPSTLLFSGTDMVAKLVVAGTDGNLYHKRKLSDLSLFPVNILNQGLRINTILKLPDRSGSFGFNKYWLAAGDGGSVYYSMDNGATFYLSEIQNVSSLSFRQFISGYIANADSVQKTILIGSSGSIFESQDMGHTWYKIISPLPYNNNAVSFTDIKKAQIHSTAGNVIRNVADYPTLFMASNPRNDLIKGDTILIPVSLNLPQKQGLNSVSSVQLKIRSVQRPDPRLLGIDTSGTLMGKKRWMLASLGDTSFLRIAAAGSNDFTESGVMFNLKAWAAESGTGLLGLDSIVVNTTRTGIEKLTSYFYIWYITLGDVDLNGYIEAYDASQILKYLSSATQLNRRQLKNANVTTDTTVSAFDASVILRYLVGLIGSLPYGGTDASGGNFSMPQLNAAVGTVLYVPVTVTSGNNIYSFEQNFSYDPAVMLFEEVDWGNNFAGFAKESVISGNSISLLAAGTTPVNISSGNMIRLRFRMLNGGQTGQTIVKMNQLRLNEMPVRNNVAQSVINIITSVEEGSDLPKEFSLSQNYPNPFNPSTVLQYTVPAESDVRIILYNSLGEEVATLVSQVQKAGYYNHELNGASLSSGVYYYRISATSVSSGENFTKTMKMILMK